MMTRPKDQAVNYRQIAEENSEELQKTGHALQELYRRGEGITDELTDNEVGPNGVFYSQIEDYPYHPNIDFRQRVSGDIVEEDTTFHNAPSFGKTMSLTKDQHTNLQANVYADGFESSEIHLYRVTDKGKKDALKKLYGPKNFLDISNWTVQMSRGFIKAGIESSKTFFIHAEHEEEDTYKANGNVGAAVLSREILSLIKSEYDISLGLLDEPGLTKSGRYSQSKRRTQEEGVLVMFPPDKDNNTLLEEDDAMIWNMQNKNPSVDLDDHTLYANKQDGGHHLQEHIHNELDKKDML